jgi:hypothetical protein
MRLWRWHGTSSGAFIAQTDKVRENRAEDVIAGVQA